MATGVDRGKVDVHLPGVHPEDEQRGCCPGNAALPSKLKPPIICLQRKRPANGSRDINWLLPDGSQQPSPDNGKPQSERIIAFIIVGQCFGISTEILGMQVQV